MGRKRILNVSLDDKTLTAIVDGLSNKLNRRDELEGIPRIYRGGLVQTIVTEHTFAVGGEVWVAPLLSGVQDRRIHLLGSSLESDSDIVSSEAWLVETSEDFVSSITMTAPFKTRPEDIIALNPTDSEGRKFVRTVGRWSWTPSPYIPCPSQIGLLDPSHGIGILGIVTAARSVDYSGILHYRELPADIS